MKRIVIIGVAGVGKTTLANTLGAMLGHPRIEMDALYWLENWTGVSNEVLRQRVDQHTTQPRWVLDGNYSVARDLIWPRADTLIWLNYSLPRAVHRVSLRTFKRWWTGEVLWSNNTERFWTSFFTKESIIWWTISTYARRQRAYPELLQLPEHAHLRVLEFRTPEQTQGFVKTLQALHEVKSGSTGVDGSL